MCTRHVNIIKQAHYIAQPTQQVYIVLSDVLIHVPISEACWLGHTQIVFKSAQCFPVKSIKN